VTREKSRSIALGLYVGADVEHEDPTRCSSIATCGAALVAQLLDGKTLRGDVQREDDVVSVHGDALQLVDRRPRDAARLPLAPVR